MFINCLALFIVALIFKRFRTIFSSSIKRSTSSWVNNATLSTLKLANALETEGIPILGTSPDAIDLAEDRERFQKLVNDLSLSQPNNGIANSDAKALQIAERIGFPLVIRPSYVLGGRAMEIVHDLDSLKRYISEAVVVSGESPVLLDNYLVVFDCKLYIHQTNHI